MLPRTTARLRDWRWRCWVKERRLQRSELVSERLRSDMATLTSETGLPRMRAAVQASMGGKSNSFCSFSRSPSLAAVWS
jgi:hypothetical protein